MKSMRQQSLSSNGYQKLAGGLILQWGSVSVPGGGGTSTISFPIAFPNACFSIQPGNPASIVKIDNINQNTFDIDNNDSMGNPSPGTLYWFAIGH